MYRLFQHLSLGILIATAGSTIGAHTSYTLEAGTFQHEEAAKSRAEMLSSQGFASVTVDHVPDAPGDFGYRVLIGNYKTKNEALAKKNELKTDLKTFVRGKYLYKHDRIDAALNGKPHKYFHLRKGMPVPANVMVQPLEPNFKKMRAEALAGPTTAPETIAAYKQMIESMPDSHPLKGREIINLAHRTFSGHSAYDRDRPDYAEIKKLLFKVATKQTSATTKQRRIAQNMVVHIVHYYEHNYVTAIQAYKQMISTEKDKRPASAAVLRTSLAGAVFEVSKISGYSAFNTQEELYKLWQENIAVQDTALTSDTKTAKRIRYATARIGLMLSESYIDQKMFKEAKIVAENLIDSYKTYKDCWGAVAESWCHLAGVYCEQRDFAKVLTSSVMAEDYATRVGQIWGDKNRDVLWKAYVWRMTAAHGLHDEKLIQETATEMKQKFADNPELMKYIHY